MKIGVPASSIVALVGPSGSGKSTFARGHFAPTEILSSDHCRALVSDDEGNQEATSDAFEVLYLVARKRAAGGRLTVVDATSVEPAARRRIVALAREFGRPLVAIVLDLPESLCRERNEGRPGRRVAPDVLREQSRSLRGSIAQLGAEGFSPVFVLSSPEEVAEARVELLPAPPPRTDRAAGD